MYEKKKKEFVVAGPKPTTGSYLFLPDTHFSCQTQKSTWQAPGELVHLMLFCMSCPTDCQTFCVCVFFECCCPPLSVLTSMAVLLCHSSWHAYSCATHPGMPTPVPLILACLLLCHSSWHAYSCATHPGMPTPVPLILACLLLCHSSWHAYSCATHPGMPTPVPLILACLLLCHSSWHAYSSP